MRFAAILVNVVIGVAIAAVVMAQTGGDDEDSTPEPTATATVGETTTPTATPTPTPTPEGTAAPVATRETHRMVIPALAGDWTPERCRTNVPDPCLLPLAQVRVTSTDGERAVTLTVELANRSDQHARGLMFRESMDELAGMLFVFAGDRSGGFWMRNTLIPLDIAYLGADGTVQEIVHGVPRSLEVLRPAAPYRYTLEVNGGWFERQGFGVGDRVAIPAGVAAE